MAALHDPRAVVWLRRVAVVLLVAGLVACASEAGSGPTDPTLLDPGETQGPVVTGSGTDRVPIPGFEDVVVEVTTEDGQVLSWCLLLAASPEQRGRGLMEITDPTLGGYDGMLFRFEEPTEGAFWMRNTPMPLSIAYVAEDGSTVTTTEMTPCEDSPDCPGYPADGPFRWAVEVPVEAGGVARLGLPQGRLRDTETACSAA